jgi:hypothetical protein
MALYVDKRGFTDNMNKDFFISGYRRMLLRVQHSLSLREELPKLTQKQLQEMEAFGKEAESLRKKIEIFRNSQASSIREILKSFNRLYPQLS